MFFFPFQTAPSFCKHKFDVAVQFFVRSFLDQLVKQHFYSPACMSFRWATLEAFLGSSLTFWLPQSCSRSCISGHMFKSECWNILIIDSRRLFFAIHCTCHCYYSKDWYQVGNNFKEVLQRRRTLSAFRGYFHTLATFKLYTCMKHILIVISNW